MLFSKGVVIAAHSILYRCHQMTFWLVHTRCWYFNSLRPSDVHMHQSTMAPLVQIMGCRLVGAKPLSDPMRQAIMWPNAPSHYLTQCLNIVKWTLRNKLQWNFNRNSYIFIKENVFENVVCDMAAILSRPQCDNVVEWRLFESVVQATIYTDAGFCLFSAKPLM